jgi:hypothetical protein
MLLNDIVFTNVVILTIFFFVAASTFIALTDIFITVEYFYMNNSKLVGSKKQVVLLPISLKRHFTVPITFNPTCSSSSEQK